MPTKLFQSPPAPIDARAAAFDAKSTLPLIWAVYGNLLNGWRVIWVDGDDGTTAPQRWADMLGDTGLSTATSNNTLGDWLNAACALALANGTPAGKLPPPFWDGDYYLGVPDGSGPYLAQGVGRVYQLAPVLGGDNAPTGVMTCTDVTPPPPPPEDPPADDGGDGGGE